MRKTVVVVLRRMVLLLGIQRRTPMAHNSSLRGRRMLDSSCGRPSSSSSSSIAGSHFPSQTIVRSHLSLLLRLRLVL